MDDNLKPANASLPLGQSFAVDITTRPVEGGTDPAYGDVLWRTLINGTRANPLEFILGVAEFPPNGVLPPHRHAPAEFYFGLDGDGVVTIDGIDHPIKPGVALYVAGFAEHGTRAGTAGLKIVYGFSEPHFDGIEYFFAPSAQAIQSSLAIEAPGAAG